MSVNVENIDDGMIMAAVRRGQSDLFGVLYRRHSAVASMYARRLARNGEDANDVVAEAFARVLDILQRGLGPAEDFRPYLMRTVRNITYDRYRAERFVELTDDMSDLDDVSEFRDLVIEGVERGLIGQAFRSLPQRWQRVLWLTCVEGHSVDAASKILGINPNAMTSLAYRAREGLRRAYLQANLPAQMPSRCAPFSAKFGTLLRGALGPTPRARVEQHLSGCTTCTGQLRELREVNSTLREQSVERVTVSSEPLPPNPMAPPVPVGGIHVWSQPQVA